MIMRRRSAALVPLCLVGGGMLASAALFAALSAMPDGARVAADSAVVQEVVPPGESPIGAGFSMPPAEAFVEIVTRPIFAANRQPAPEQEPTMETVASQLELRLIGVVVAAGTSVAIVAASGSDSFVRVTVGDRFQGWTVEQIEPHRVTFRRDNTVERIELGYDVPPTRPRPAKAPTDDEKTKKN